MMDTRPYRTYDGLVHWRYALRGGLMVCGQLVAEQLEMGAARFICDTWITCMRCVVERDRQEILGFVA